MWLPVVFGYAIVRIALPHIWANGGSAMRIVVEVVIEYFLWIMVVYGGSFLAAFSIARILFRSARRKEELIRPH
jgi:hypothetical protein